MSDYEAQHHHHQSSGEYLPENCIDPFNTVGEDGVSAMGDYEEQHHQHSGGYLPENGIKPFNTVEEDGILAMGEPSLLVDSGSDEEDDPKKKGKGSQAKNLMAERRRRKKLNERLYALRSLVPTITKLDRASILKDAIDYVKELQNEAKELQDKLEENPETEDRFHQGLWCNSNVPNHVDHDNSNDKAQEMEPQVDVAQLDGRGFFVKVICEHKPGGFTKLMESLDALGLEVTNANTTRYLSLVSNVFQVEKNDNEMVTGEHVRNSLLDDQMVIGSMQNDKNEEVDYQHFNDHNHHGGSHHHLHDHQMTQTTHHQQQHHHS